MITAGRPRGSPLTLRSEERGPTREADRDRTRTGPQGGAACPGGREDPEVERTIPF